MVTAEYQKHLLKARSAFDGILLTNKRFLGYLKGNHTILRAPVLAETTTADGEAVVPATREVSWTMKKDLGGIIAVFPLLSLKSCISTHPLIPVPLKAEVSVLQKRLHEHQSETRARLEESNPRFHAFFFDANGSGREAGSSTPGPCIDELIPISSTVTAQAAAEKKNRPNKPAQ